MGSRSREQVFALVRDHLADELDVDAQAIGEDTRFREDLEADSLDLYTLVQELEDTYGVKMSDEEAVRHALGPRSTSEHALTAFARVEGECVVYDRGQLDLDAAASGVRRDRR